MLNLAQGGHEEPLPRPSAGLRDRSAVGAVPVPPHGLWSGSQVRCRCPCRRQPSRAGQGRRALCSRSAPARLLRPAPSPRVFARPGSPVAAGRGWEGTPEVFLPAPAQEGSCAAGCPGPRPDGARASVLPSVLLCVKMLPGGSVCRAGSAPVRGCCFSSFSSTCQKCRPCLLNGSVGFDAAGTTDLRLGCAVGRAAFHPWHFSRQLVHALSQTTLPC